MNETPTFVPLGAWLRAHIPDHLRGGDFLLENWQWVGVGAALLLAAIATRLLRAIASSLGRRLFLRFVPGGDVRKVRRAAIPLGYAGGAVFAHLAFLALDLPKPVLAPLRVATSFAALAAGLITIYRFVDLFTAQLEERAKRTTSRYDDLLVPLLRKSAKVAVVAFGLVFVADNLGVDTSSLLAGLGLGGLAVALAAQDTVKNLFGSLTVLVDKPFQIGDLVTLGDVEGTVEEVGFRSTRVRTATNSLVTVPNANLISSNVENLGVRAWRRWLTRIGVTYDTPPSKIEAFCEGIRELARRHPETKKDAIDVWANEFGASAIEILCAVHFHSTTAAAELEHRHGLLLDILRLAEDLDVELALPAQTIHVRESGVSRRPAGPPRDSRSPATSDPAPGDRRGT